MINSVGQCAIIAVGGSTLNIEGGEISNESIYAAIQGNGNTSSAGTVINISGGKIESINSDTTIYMPQRSTAFNITGGEIIGNTALYVKSGNINITGGNITGNGELARYIYDANGCHGTGDAFVIDSCNYPGGKPIVSVSGGTFTSVNNQSVASYVAQDDDSYKGEPAQQVIEFITGGFFTNKPKAELIADGYEACQSGDFWEVIPTN